MSQPHGDSTAPDQKLSAREFFRSPAFIVILVILAVGAWFIISFVTTATQPEKSLNYNGVAEVVQVNETQTKCFVNIRRDNGKVTKQQMAKDSCRLFREGDMINIKNGQYVSTR